MFRPLPRLLLAFLLACAIGADTAAARVPSSGGYSRPSTSSSSGSYTRPAPSRSYSAPPFRGSSGGYAAPTRRPSTGYSSAPTSGGDAAISRQSSGQALRDYRDSQARAQAVPQGGYSGTGDRRPSTYGPSAGVSGGVVGGYTQPRPWSPTYAPPAYGWAQQGRSFGVWDGLMLWSLLNSLSAAGHADFFHNNQDSPDYQRWRAEADRTAARDPTLQARLDDLDQRLALMNGQPRQPGAPPPPAARSGDGGFMNVVIVLLLLVAAFTVLWYWRRHASAHAAMPGAPAALKGSAQTRFRVGMIIPVDPTPFVLAGGATKIRPIDGGGVISVEAVGVLMDGGIPLNRLYLPGRDAFFQLHLGADGKPDECRYFSRIDQVTPASQEEWGAWLDPAQGMIGWPQFQTKDGKLYDRAWAPGSERIQPRALEETIEDLQGKSGRKLATMLYARPTGAPVPAPQQEYILVSAVDQTGQAWVDIHAGIDINPATLTLPSVALS
jgi:uncharacterized protein DUF2491